MAELPDQSRFCLRCGTPVPSVQPGSPGPVFASPSSFVSPVAASLPSSGNRNLKIAMATMIVVIAALSAAVVHGGLFHAPRSSENGSLVNAPGQSGPSSLVQAPGDSNANPLVQSPGTSQAPPDIERKPGEVENVADIVDYLKFLKGIEEDRQALQHTEYSHVQTLMTTMTANTFREGLRGTDDSSAHGDPKVEDVMPDQGKYIEQIHVDWQALSKRFVERQPPSACVDLRNKYLDQLGKTEAGISKAVGLIAASSKDPSAALQSAYAEQGTSGNVDAALADAESELEGVFHKYGLHQNFRIRDADAGGTSGMLGGLFGN